MVSVGTLLNNNFLCCRIGFSRNVGTYGEDFIWRNYISRQVFKYDMIILMLKFKMNTGFGKPLVHFQC